MALKELLDKCLEDAAQTTCGLRPEQQSKKTLIDLMRGYRAEYLAKKEVPECQE
jgi:hypothetical protein